MSLSYGSATVTIRKTCEGKRSECKKWNDVKRKEVTTGEKETRQVLDDKKKVKVKYKIKTYRIERGKDDEGKKKYRREKKKNKWRWEKGNVISEETSGEKEEVKVTKKKHTVRNILRLCLWVCDRRFKEELYHLHLYQHEHHHHHQEDQRASPPPNTTSLFTCMVSCLLTCDLLIAR